MARLARVIAPKLPHHVIQRGVRSMEIFATDDDREVYLALLAGSIEGDRIPQFGLILSLRKQ